MEDREIYDRISEKNAFSFLNTLDRELQRMRPDGKSVHTINGFRHQVINIADMIEDLGYSSASFKELANKDPEICEFGISVIYKLLNYTKIGIC